MKIVTADFIKSAMKPEQYPVDGKPEFAFVGRSNVGKSSMLNTLLRRKGLAKTSSTPGKTQTINFFMINKAFYLVDLPGYGFAKVPQPVKEAWVRVLTAYLRARDPLRLAVLLVDARHDPSDKDVEMLELLDMAEVPTLIVATKVDKLKTSEKVRNLKKIREVLELDEDAMIIPFSAETREGMADLWGVINTLLKEPVSKGEL
jgi:GTP-binding protein